MWRSCVDSWDHASRAAVRGPCLLPSRVDSWDHGGEFRTRSVWCASEWGMRGDDDLTRWVRDGYARAYRSAVLICGNPADAEEAVQDAFLRVWRFRDALPNGDGREPWFYRVLVNACYSKLRREIPRRD